MKIFPRFLLTVLLMAIFGTLGYLYINSQSVVVPDTPAIDMENIEENSSIREKDESLRQYLKQKKIELEYQGRLLKEKRDLLAKRRQEIEYHILMETEKIRTGYQEKLDSYQKELEQQYQEFVKKKEQEFLEQVAVKKELYAEKLQQQLENLQETYLAELEEYKEDIVRAFYLAKLNYDLKLNLLDLPAEEKEKYLEEYSDLEAQYMASLQEKEAAILEEMENRIMELEDGYNLELDEYKRRLENTIKKELEDEKVRNQQALWNYLEEQQKKMEEEIEKKIEEIRVYSRQELATLEALIQDISREYFSLESELSILEKEVMY
ncbi:MAG: hypothetical protein GX336_06725 [Halanaerobiaceae bacterium]|nr:hypothetical protein [Halanaerobiaceae bacterium]